MADDVIVLDRGDQQVLGVMGVEGMIGLEAGQMGEEQAPGDWLWVCSAEDAAAIRGAHRDRRPILAAGAIAQGRAASETSWSGPGG